MRHEVEHVLQQRSRSIPATHSERGVPVNADPRLEAAAERPDRPGVRGPAPRATPDPRAPVQCLRLTQDGGRWKAVPDAREDALAPDSLSNKQRQQVVDHLLEAGDQASVLELTAGWLDGENFRQVEGRAAQRIAALVGAYPDQDVDQGQGLIQQVIPQVVQSLAEAVMGKAGLNPKRYALLLMGSAARGEMFPGSDVDLVVLGRHPLAPGVGPLVQNKIAALLASAVRSGYQDAGVDLPKDANGKPKLPFGFDACLGKPLFHTVESAVQEALVGDLASDNMVQDAMLLNSGSRQAKELLTDFRIGYRSVLQWRPAGPEKDQPFDVQSSFLPERIVSMRQMLAQAVHQLDEGDLFDVKKALLRLPSLIARDYYIFRKGLAYDPHTTIARLDSFTKGPVDTRLSDATVAGLKAGFEYGTSERWKAHAAAAGKQDKLEVGPRQAELTLHLENYSKALHEISRIAVGKQLKVRAMTPVKKAGGKKAVDPTIRLKKQWDAIVKRVGEGKSHESLKRLGKVGKPH